MKTTDTIYMNFAKRMVMVIAIIAMASSAWSMSTSDIESTAATSITDGAAYVIATAYNGTYLTNEAYADWGRVSTDINESAIFTAHGTTSGFYLIGPNGRMTAAAGSKFTAYDNENENNLKLNTSNQICNLTTEAINLRYNSTGLRWYNGTTGNSVYLYKIKSKYTITYDPGTGSCKTNDSEASAGSGITLATASPSASCTASGWVFAGWKQSNALTETTSIPTLISGGSTYHPHSNETLYAVYRLGNVYTIDFENTTDTYTAWTFTQINSKGTNSYISAYGSYIGLTTSTVPGSLQTKSKIASPKEICFKISKTTSNTSNSTWQVYTSSDGTSWTSRKSQDAKEMAQGQWLEVSQDLSSYSNVFVKIEYSGSNAIRAIDDVILSCATYNSNPSCCDKIVALSKGTESNGTITLGETNLSTCSATASDRQVTISVEPNTGFDVPADLTWEQTSGTAFSAPTKISGPTKNGTLYDYVYQFPQNASGAGTFGVTARAFTNFRTNCCTESGLTFGTIASPVTEYVIVREDLASASTEVSIDCNFESLNTTTDITWHSSKRAAKTFPTTAASSKVTLPQWTHFAIDIENKKISASQTGVYTLTIQQAEATVSGTTYCGQRASVSVIVKTVDKFIDAVNGNFSGEAQRLEDTGGGILLPTEAAFSTNNGCADGVARRLIGWIKASDLNSTTSASSYLRSGRVDTIDNLKTDNASNKVIAPGTRVAATGITWYAVWGEEVTP